MAETQMDVYTTHRLEPTSNVHIMDYSSSSNEYWEINKPIGHAIQLLILCCTLLLYLLTSSTNRISIVYILLII